MAAAEAPPVEVIIFETTTTPDGLSVTNLLGSSIGCLRPDVGSA